MKKLLKINRIDFVDIDNIAKFVIKKEHVWVYQKIGYPKIRKSWENIDVLKNRLVNLGHTIHEFVVEDER